MSPHSCDRAGEWPLTCPTPGLAAERCEMPSLVPSCPLLQLMPGRGVSPYHPNLMTGLRDLSFCSPLLVPGWGWLSPRDRLRVLPLLLSPVEASAVSQQRQEAFMEAGNWGLGGCWGDSVWPRARCGSPRFPSPGAHQKDWPGDAPELGVNAHHPGFSSSAERRQPRRASPAAAHRLGDPREAGVSCIPLDPAGHWAG